MHNQRIIYVDDTTESVGTLFKLRTPPLFIGLLLGIGISFITSRFESVLQENIYAAFFLPFIVYIADAIGTQTQTIYNRDAKVKKIKLHIYMVKESVLGVTFGSMFGVISAVVVWLWLGSDRLAASVGISVFVAVATAPLIALMVSEASRHIKKDPAAEAGPIATVVQDMLSVVIYGAVCAIILTQ